MTPLPFSRGLPLFLTFIVVLGLGGCLSRSPAPRFYTLSPLPEAQGVARRKAPSPPVRVGLGPIKLADYLDQNRLVTRTGDHQAVRSEYDRWIGSFKDEVTQVLADNLGLLLHTEEVYRYPWRTSVPVDYQVTVDVGRCDGRLGEAAWLEARWSVLAGPERELLTTRRSVIQEPVAEAGYAGLVAAQSRALGRLSREIARTIQGTHGETGSSRRSSARKEETRPK
jgi:uncharacterized lipoprotein YmbA